MRYNSKYGSVKVTLDGITFDSRAEMRRYCELKLLLRAGEISNLMLQPEFVILDGFIYKDKKERDIKYIADFAYIDNKTHLRVVEDVKGFKTDVYQLKRKMFIARYCVNNEAIIFREI